jgi:hypothetical protein
MKFDSSALPQLPTAEHLTEINDLLLTATELCQIYAALERHPRVISSPKSLELFSTCREQLHQDVSVLDEQLEGLLALSHASSQKDAGDVEEEEGAVFAHTEGTEASHPFHFIPDVEPMDVGKSVFEIVRRLFQIESLFSEQLAKCLNSAQNRKHLKLELQLKMIILSVDQRSKLLEDRYGYAKSKSLLFQGLKRQTTRFLSALSGEKRTDIDQ